jgi:hypothetical protein
MDVSWNPYNPDDMDTSVQDQKDIASNMRDDFESYGEQGRAFSLNEQSVNILFLASVGGC